MAHLKINCVNFLTTRIITELNNMVHDRAWIPEIQIRLDKSPENNMLSALPENYAIGTIIV